MRADNTAYIIDAAQQRHQLTRAKAVKALRELHRAGTPITFEAVARQARISRSWLYAQPDLRAEIERLREATRQTGPAPVPVAQRASDDSLRQRLNTANERNRQLTADNQRLRRQLAEALGQIRMPGNPRSSVTIDPH